MNDRRLEILDWPEQLHHVLDHLERTTHQEFTKTQMDDGFVRRAPVTSPMSAFKGNVSLSRAERAALNEFYAAGTGCHFSFKDPLTGRHNSLVSGATCLRRCTPLKARIAVPIHQKGQLAVRGAVARVRYGARTMEDRP